MYIYRERERERERSISCRDNAKGNENNCLGSIMENQMDNYGK